ncbi:helix-turn-helix domain-containing protein [Streptomyces sp. HP-A2021]|uniref:helix-turn-helix domain-containing protein n=1 Tax=Streptomyces sp. HP-A2021 TaxID=2927875 RepID=UPI001FAF34D2|nr:helix-turn-helix transcriptional regulator [Streptomyces sp. HP-A2021]UOB09145.1 helix-turn-helix domain-containing protein [Streptomyces sp. HP-A2021]
MATPDLDRLAKYVKAHRMETFTSRKAAADTAGISKDTWQKVEEGQDVRESTYAKIDRALGWATGSCTAIARGDEPILVGTSGATATIAPAPPPPISADELRRAAFEAARAKLPGAPIGDIDAFSDELVEILRRAGQVTDGA